MVNIMSDLLSKLIPNNHPSSEMEAKDGPDHKKTVPTKEELSMDEVFLTKLKASIDENLETKDFGVDELGREIGMSRSQIHRKLQSLSGIAPSKYIKTRKLQKARDLLQRNVGTVSEMSFRFGFSSPAYFTQVYTEEFGYPPSEEQKSAKSNVGNILDDGKLAGQRKLAAIMFTDIAGYTALMGRDEAKAIEVLRQNREIQRPLIEAHNGKWLKEMGDGVLAQFDSAYDSVICALKIQRKAMMGFEAKIRIGIHLGDVTIDNEDVFGDGVNIASRLESIADPGGVYISESIQKALRGRDEIKVQHLGEVQLKNVDYLVSTYCLVEDGLPIPSASRIRQLRASSVIESGAQLSNINDQLIKEVFDELSKAKPTVQRFIEMMEEEGDDPDIRELADLIIRNYPWVIGVELRRLFSGSLRILDGERLEQILISIHRALQFLSFMLIVELYEAVSKARTTVTDEFRKELNSRFHELSSNDFLWIIQEVGKKLDTENLDRFIPEISKVLDDEFYEELNFSMPPRGPSGDFEIHVPVDEIARSCFQYQEKLSLLLRKLAFITPYKLVTIKEIKVLKSRNHQALFEHRMDILSSSDSDFRSKEEKFETYSDSNAVLLMKSLKRPDDFLNLSPFIIDTRGEALDTKEKFNIKKDIFICEGFANNNIRYAGTEIAEHCDLSSLNNYHNLVEEFNVIMKMEETLDQNKE